jgi:ribosomal protein S27E
VSKVEGQLTSRFGHGSDVYKKAEKEVVCPDCGKVFYLQGS